MNKSVVLNKKHIGTDTCTEEIVFALGDDYSLEKYQNGPNLYIYKYIHDINKPNNLLLTEDGYNYIKEVVLKEEKNEKE